MRRPRLRLPLSILVALIIATALFAASASTQQSTQERAAWDVQMARNAQASSTITIRNSCSQTHTFTVTEQGTPFLQLLAAPTVKVRGHSSYNLPVRFNTSGMNAARYQGTVVVKCETCGKEKLCTQDRELLPVRLAVLPENAPPGAVPGGLVIPGPQPGGPPASGRPVIGAPPGKPVATSTAKIAGWDPETGKNTEEREFGDGQEPCKGKTCPAINKKPDKNKKDELLYCTVKDCGTKECPASCRMFQAWKDFKAYQASHADAKDDGLWKKWTMIKDGVGEANAITAEKGKMIYTCACK